MYALTSKGTEMKEDLYIVKVSPGNYYGTFTYEQAFSFVEKCKLNPDNKYLKYTLIHLLVPEEFFQ